MKIGLHIELTEEQKKLLINALKMRLHRCSDNAWEQEADQVRGLLEEIEQGWTRANTPEYPNQMRCVCGCWVGVGDRVIGNFTEYWYCCNFCDRLEDHVIVSPEIAAYLADERQESVRLAEEIFGKGN
jgi:hypothetical protein